MKKFIIVTGIVIVILILLISSSSKINYAKSITIYDGLTYTEGVKCSAADLEKCRSHSIDIKRINYSDDFVLWKGDKFGVLYFENGSEINVKVSVYGDFFTVVGQKGCYTFRY